MRALRGSIATRRRLVAAAAAVLVLVPTAAQAAPDFYVTPLFGIAAVADGRVLVADAGQGVVDADDGSLVANLPGVTDVTAMANGELWATTGGGVGEHGVQKLYRIDANGNAVEFADLDQFEAKRNPHPTTVESNPFDVADLGGGAALVADAAGNDLITVNKHGKAKLVAVFPDEPVPTADVKSLVGCPDPFDGFEEICDLPPSMPAEAVPASVAVGPDGAYYVGELKGFPAPTGESKVWRIEPNARNAKCGKSPLCSVILDGFTSIIDLAFGPDGRLYVVQLNDESWFALELAQAGLAAPAEGSVHACDLATQACSEIATAVPIPTSITFRNDGSLWGSIWALVPGTADVVPLAAWAS